MVMACGYAAAFSPDCGRAFSRAAASGTDVSEEEPPFLESGNTPEDGPNAARIDPEKASADPERFSS